MVIRTKLGSVAVSIDTETSDWHVLHWYSKMMGSRSQWFKDCYPELPIMCNKTIHQPSFMIILEWYVDFPNQESFAHYTLTHG